jgi:WD40 repeat protein
VVYDAKTFKQLTSKKFDNDVFYESLSPDKTLLSTRDADGTHIIRTSDFSTVFSAQGSIAFNGDGSRAAVYSTLRPVEIHDMKTGKLQNTLNYEEVKSVVFSDDNKLMACVLGDNSVHVFDAESFKEIQVIEQYRMPVCKIQFSPDSGSLFIGLDDFSIRRVDIGTGEEIAQLDGHSGIFDHVEFSPDASLYITVDEDKGAILWKAGSNKKIGEVHWFQGISPDFKKIVSSNGKTLILVPVYDMKALAAEAEKQLGGMSLSDQEKKDLYIVD